MKALKITKNLKQLENVNQKVSNLFRATVGSFYVASVKGMEPSRNTSLNAAKEQRGILN